MCYVYNHTYYLHSYYLYAYAGMYEIKKKKSTWSETRHMIFSQDFYKVIEIIFAIESRKSELYYITILTKVPPPPVAEPYYAQNW